jgi:hypothetical protein
MYSMIRLGASPGKRQPAEHRSEAEVRPLPDQNITWVPPDGGGGPNYPNM